MPITSLDPTLQGLFAFLVAPVFNSEQSVSYLLIGRPARSRRPSAPAGMPSLLCMGYDSAQGLVKLPRG